MTRMYEWGEEAAGQMRSPRFPPAYRAQEQFVAPARASCEPWRLLPAIVVTVSLYIALLWLLQALLAALLPTPVFQHLREVIATGETAGGALYLLFSFGFMAVAMATVVTQMHRRSPWSLLGAPRLALRQGLAVLFALVLLLVALWVLPPAEWPQPLPAPRPFASWLLWLPLALVALLIQTGTEELVFRGYLQQQLAARFSHPLVWMVAPAILFGLLHYRPEAGDNAWLIMLWAAGFAMIAADLTARAGTLGPAIALHFLSNFVAIVLLSQDQALSGLALYVVPMDLSDAAQLRPALLLDTAITLVGWLAARLALKR